VTDYDNNSVREDDLHGAADASRRAEMAVTTIDLTHHDPADLLDAVTSALHDGATTWLALDGKRRAVIGPAPQIEAATPGELTYEGEVRFADGTRLSLQCFERRCIECPDETTEEPERRHMADGPLQGGYNCECLNCSHGPAASREATDPPFEDPRDAVARLAKQSGAQQSRSGEGSKVPPADAEERMILAVSDGVDYAKQQLGLGSERDDDLADVIARAIEDAWHRPGQPPTWRQFIAEHYDAKPATPGDPATWWDFTPAAEGEATAEDAATEAGNRDVSPEDAGAEILAWGDAHDMLTGTYNQVYDQATTLLELAARTTTGASFHTADAKVTVHVTASGWFYFTTETKSFAQHLSDTIGEPYADATPAEGRQSAPEVIQVQPSAERERTTARKASGAEGPAAAFLRRAGELTTGSGIYADTDPGAASRQHVSRAWVYAANGRFREADQELQLALDACGDGPAGRALTELRGFLPEGIATASRPVDFPVIDTGRTAQSGTGLQSPAPSKESLPPVARLQGPRPGNRARTQPGHGTRPTNGGGPS
jgi:hypothetical protein